LRLDTVPKFVQIIKLVQEEFGVGNADVRAPKLRLTDEELQATRNLIHRSLRTRPQRASTELRLRQAK
jgi:4-hydroxy-tetrahydrodipicolinate synthase